MAVDGVATLWLLLLREKLLLLILLRKSTTPVVGVQLVLRLTSLGSIRNDLVDLLGHLLIVSEEVGVILIADNLMLR